MDYFRPTFHLRFVERTIKKAHPQMGGGVYNVPVRILQQEFEDSSTNGAKEWRDVPFVLPEEE